MHCNFKWESIHKDEKLYVLTQTNKTGNYTLLNENPNEGNYLTLDNEVNILVDEENILITKHKTSYLLTQLYGASVKVIDLGVIYPNDVSFSNVKVNISFDINNEDINKYDIAGFKEFTPNYQKDRRSFSFYLNVDEKTLINKVKIPEPEINNYLSFEEF